MGKGKKILIGIIIAIIIIVLAIIGTYYIAFKPKVETAPITQMTQVDKITIANKFKAVEDIAKSGVKKQANVELTSPELTTMAAEVVSKSPTAKKYITGVKVATDKNHLVLYVTGALNKVSSQAKINFTVKSENGNAVLHYEGGKVGFINIPESEILSRIPNNNYITVDKQDGDIIINPKEKDGLNISDMKINKSNLNIQFN